MTHRFYKIFVFVFLFSFCLSNRAFAIAWDNSKDSIIEWKPKIKLNWVDFRGLPNPIFSNTKAYSYLSISYNPISNKKKDSLYVQVKCTFNRNKSWVSFKTDDLLIHEQVHFDIAEYYARILVKKIQSIKEINSRTISSNLKVIFDKIYKDYNSMQQQYDLQTNHSLDANNQIKWNNKIDSLLTSIANYSVKVAKIKIKY